MKKNEKECNDVMEIVIFQLFKFAIVLDIKIIIGIPYINDISYTHKAKELNMVLQ